MGTTSTSDDPMMHHTAQAAALPCSRTIVARGPPALKRLAQRSCITTGRRRSINSESCHPIGAISYQPSSRCVTNIKAGRLGLALLIVGARWGAIIGRCEAIPSPLHRSISVVHQVPTYCQPHRAIARASFASRGQGSNPSPPPSSSSSGACSTFASVGIADGGRGAAARVAALAVTRAGGSRCAGQGRLDRGG